jgi:hypothetical protein
MYYKGHGEVKVDIMLLLVATNCWTRSFALGYWLFYFSSVFWLRWEKKDLCRCKIISSENVCCLIYPCPYWGQSIFVTVGNYIVLNQLIAGSIMVRHMIFILVLSLPLRVFYLMRCTHNALWGGSHHEQLWYYNIKFWLCLLFLARSARFVITGWYVHTFSVLHGFCCPLKTWVARVQKVAVVPSDCPVL